MTTYFRPPNNLTQVAGPSASQDASQSATYDYSGADDQIKRRDLLPQLVGQRYAALYGGDIPGSVAAGHQIRDLIDSIRNPRQPMVRVSSQSSSGSSSYDSGGYAGSSDPFNIPVKKDKDGPVAPVPVPPKPAAAPKPAMAPQPAPKPAGGGFTGTPPYALSPHQNSQWVNDQLRMMGYTQPTSKPQPLPSMYAITPGEQKDALDRFARQAGF